MKVRSSTCPNQIARASRDLLVDDDDRVAFLDSYCEGYGREFLCSLIDAERPDMPKKRRKKSWTTACAAMA